MMRISWIVGAIGLLALLLMPASSQACMTDDCQICWDFGCSTCTTSPLRTSCTDCGAQQLTAFEPTRTATVTFLGDRKAELVIPEYSTTQLQPITSCIVAFSPVPGVEDVEGVVNYNSDTGQPFDEVVFLPSSTPGPAAAELATKVGLPLASDTPWHGFQSQITGTVRDGVPNHFKLVLTLEEGVTPSEFLDALKLHGTFLTSSSDPNGIPTEHHNSFRRLGASNLVVNFADGVDPEILDGPDTGIQRLTTFD